MKKRGFTLIELLAVIVILAIIALIATPLVLKYIETSRQESFKVSVENIKDSALKYVASQQLEGKVTYPVIVDVKDLDFKGKEDYTGKVRVLKNGIVEEFVEKDDYRSGNGGFINKKIEPYLKVKEGQTAVIDDKNKLVYSFWNNDDVQLIYTSNYLNENLLNSIFEVNNGSIAFERYISGRIANFSTGSKVIVKDNEGNIDSEYQIVIFGDLDGNGRIVLNDVTELLAYVDGDIELTGAFLKAADINFDGEVTYDDGVILSNIFDGTYTYNQITNKIIEA